MAFTPAPTPPNSGDPGPYNQRADAFVGWMAQFVDELNAELPFISSKNWATYGGSANAIALTAGFVSLVKGMQVRFRATAANTGAATINLDGLGAKACRTITGAVLPTGYIRTDADTLATYDGANWVVDRQIERGSNANGQYVRLADGTQNCQIVDVDMGSVTALGAGTFADPFRTDTPTSITWPASFIGAPTTAPILRLSGDSVVSANARALLLQVANAPTASGWESLRAQRVSADNTARNALLTLTATGRWY